MIESAECCSCHQKKECFSLRKGVIRCADCVCEAAGKSLMDLFRKGIKPISGTIHVLVAVSGGSSSMFTLDVLARRLTPNMKGKTTIVRKLEAITSNTDLDFKVTFPQNSESGSVPTSEIPLHKIPNFTICSIVEFAKANDFNCVILADNVDRISLANLAVLSCGRPELAYYISSDDYNNYLPVTVLRPARQILSAEAKFYCNHKGIKVDDTDSAFRNAFKNEETMLQHIVEDGNGDISFAVQRLGEKLAPFKQDGRCPSCGLPAPNNEICDFCSTILKHG